MTSFCCVLLIYQLESNSVDFGKNVDSTAFIYETIVMTSAPITQIISSACFWRTRLRTLQIVVSIIRLDNRHLPSINLKDDVTLKLFVVWLVTLALAMGHAIYLFALIFVEISPLQILSIFLRTLPLIFNGLIMLYHASIVIIVTDIMCMLNFDIESVLDSKYQNSNVNLKPLLRQRSWLIEFCSRDINELYGICVLFNMLSNLIVLISVPLSIKYFIEVEKAIDISEFFVACGIIACALPTVVITVIVFNEGCVQIQANKTARILSRISRRGTDIEKMVDKFLMKNLQQRPILTAYGFFPLNKRTLFKIFAAIFTYMVILIQFKDMENTNKKLVGTKTTTL
ncbi:gustatory and pheromone receptor 39a-like isoform X1 [Eupeodes corollae]|uniref:gustatory and pheromone receptor 39a-like isoform X1 n=1 Tax=Eupeodes corollae TaxID=290404 RepID=UPI0024929F2A|nr:gustatory and pheromone receptor 39a-like isoform X1 [Eupeodes corollae]